jgi:hypothetical protein
VETKNIQRAPEKNAKIAMDDDNGDVDAATAMTAMTAERDADATTTMEEEENTDTAKKDLPPPRLVIERMVRFCLLVTDRPAEKDSSFFSLFAAIAAIAFPSTTTTTNNNHYSLLSSNWKISKVMRANKISDHFTNVYQPWSDPMAVANPMSLMPCCLFLANVRNNYV